ncbi:C-terminal binding protein [Microbacterium sp. NPDC058021]|uniref:C-terminal binding protein n=1 Tax=Microbacterium sp. NPDC058021 TaxID=3346306 RepID=UPI0036D9E46E
MTARPVAVITDVTDLSPEPARRILVDAGFDVEVLRWDVTHEVPERARAAVAALAGYAHLGADFFAAFPNLRWIGTASTGSDMVDAVSAAAHGVTVRPLAGASTEEVATHALALTLATERDLRDAQDVVARGQWTDAFERLPRRLSELTLGLCGLGRIGARFAEMASPLFGRVIGYDPSALAPGVEPVGFDELLAQSDVLSLHLPLLPETRGLIGASEIGRMRPGATLINVSRGELVDLSALAAALDDGTLRGAGLDVLDAEPPRADHPLRAHPRAVVTPHMGFLSATSLRSYECEPAEALVAWWSGHNV